MKLSAPIFLLKQQAKALARTRAIPLHRALDVIAAREGFRSWSALAAARAAERPAAELYSALRPRDLVLLGARPGQGKTLLGLELAIMAVRHGYHAAFFSLDLSQRDVARCIGTVGASPRALGNRLLVDTSDDICAAYITKRLDAASARTLVVVDYLQLLDQRRSNPALAEQIGQLKTFAVRCRTVVVCLSQIDRCYDPSARPCPGIGDVRLPNPVDMTAFDAACFLHGGRMEFSAPAGRH